MPLITGIITENVTLTVKKESVGKGTSGGNKPTYTTVATGVSAFLGLPSGPRSGWFNADNATDTATLVSSSSYVGRSDVVFLVTATSDPALSTMVGTTWRVDSPTSFPAGSLGIVPARYEAKVSRFVIPPP